MSKCMRRMRKSFSRILRLHSLNCKNWEFHSSPKVLFLNSRDYNKSHINWTGIQPPIGIASMPYPKKKKGTMATERTYIMVKPDGVERGLVGTLKCLKSRLGSRETYPNPIIFLYDWAVLTSQFFR